MTLKGVKVSSRTPRSIDLLFFSDTVIELGLFCVSKISSKIHSRMTNKETSFWAGVYENLIGSLHNKFILFFQCSHFVLSYDCFLRKNRSEMNSKSIIMGILRPARMPHHVVQQPTVI